MKSIKTKIIALLVLAVVLASVSLGILSCVLNFRSAMKVMEETITDTASVAAEQITASLQSRLNIAVEAGCLTRLSGTESTLADKQALINQKM